MKTRKILFSLSAIGLTLCLIRALFGHHVTYEFAQTYLEPILSNPIYKEIYWSSYMWVLSCSIILALAGFLIEDNTPAIKSRLFRYSTITLTALTIITTIVALFTMHCYYGLRVLWAPFWLRIILLLTAIIWLIALAFTPLIGKISKELRWGVIVGICLIALPLLLQIVSAIAYFSNGHILHLHSNALFTWMRYFVPVVLLLWYCVWQYHSRYCLQDTSTTCGQPLCSHFSEDFTANGLNNQQVTDMQDVIDPNKDTLSGENQSDNICIVNGKRISSDNIRTLNSDEIFVFGSNRDGQHAGGAAYYAYSHFGAEWGEGEGLYGQSYALPTMEGEKSFREAVARFITFAEAHQEYTFLVTAVGCGIAGYSTEEVAPFFAAAAKLTNVYLPKSFIQVLESINTI